jgi:hypothetical protein
MHRYPDTGGPATFVAVVHDSDRVVFSASTLTRASLIEAITEFVACNAHVLLWPTDSTHVQRLLRTGQAEAAIDHYFACVGDRWDKQWLVTSAVSGSIAVAQLDRIAPHCLDSPLPAAG